MIIYNGGFQQTQLNRLEVIYIFTKLVHISSFEDAKRFVNLTTKYDDVSMRLRIDNYEIDAHSIVGVLSIVDDDTNAVFTANLPDNDKTLLSEIEPFLARSN